MESSQETPQAKPEPSRDDLILKVAAEAKDLLDQSQSRAGPLRERVIDSDPWMVAQTLRGYAALQQDTDSLISSYVSPPEQGPTSQERRYNVIVRKINELEVEIDGLAKKAPQVNFIEYHDTIKTGFSNLRNYVAQLTKPKEPTESSQKTTP